MWNSVTASLQPSPARCQTSSSDMVYALGSRTLLAERAQPATGHADVGGIDVAVDVEVGRVAVQPLAHEVGQVAERQDIGGAVQRQAVLEGQPLAGFHFVANRDQTGIFE